MKMIINTNRKKETRPKNSWLGMPSPAYSAVFNIIQIAVVKSALTSVATKIDKTKRQSVKTMSYYPQI